MLHCAIASRIAAVARVHRPAATPLEARLARQHAAGLHTAPIERFQHGQDLAPEVMDRAPHRIASGVQTLFDAKSIRTSELISCDRFRDDYLLREGVRDSEPIPGARSGIEARHVMQLARIKAGMAHAVIANALGPEFTHLLMSFIVGDLSCAAMDRRYRMDTSDGPKRMAGRMEVLLIMLTRVYLGIDRKRAASPARPIRDNRGSAAQHLVAA